MTQQGRVWLGMPPKRPIGLHSQPEWQKMGLGPDCGAWNFCSQNPQTTTWYVSAADLQPWAGRYVVAKSAGSGGGGLGLDQRKTP